MMSHGWLGLVHSLNGAWWSQRLRHSFIFHLQTRVKMWRNDRRRALKWFDDCVQICNGCQRKLIALVLWFSAVFFSFVLYFWFIGCDFWFSAVLFRLIIIIILLYIIDCSLFLVKLIIGCEFVCRGRKKCQSIQAIGLNNKIITLKIMHEKSR